MDWVRESMVFLAEKNYSWVASLSAIDFLENDLWEDSRFPAHLKKYLLHFPGFDHNNVEAMEHLIPDLFELSMDELSQLSTHNDENATMKEKYLEKDSELPVLMGLLSKVLKFEDVDSRNKGMQYWHPSYRNQENVAQISQHAAMCMSPKKKHEVAIMSDLICSLLSHSMNHVVELGCGQGYLSSFLALKNPINDISILGIDLSERNCLAAAERHSKIAKAKAFRAATKDAKIHFLPGYFSENSPKELYQGDEGQLSIWTSLHGCGNLSVAMLRKWSEEKNAQILLQVGCCYHRLNVPENFPLSNHFRMLKLNKGLLNVACQAPPERRISYKEMLLHYYGTLFHILLIRMGRINVSRFGDEFDSSSLPFLGSMKGIPVHLGFGAFVRAILLTRTGQRTSQRDEIMKGLLEGEMNFTSILPELKDPDSFRKLSFLLVIQRLLGPCYEMLILADRVQWLRELGYAASLTRIFDRNISPRSYLVSSHK